jgi:hypothetical protein
MPSTHRDDSQMSRFDREGVRRVTARDAIKAMAVTAVVLILFSGNSIGNAADELGPGLERDVLEVVGAPAGWIADNTPLEEAGNSITAGLSPDSELGAGGFASEATSGTAAEIAPVTPDSFDPTAIGAEPEDAGELETVLVTGDSLSTPLDQEIARRLSPEGVEVIQDPHLASGISNDAIVDWGQLSTSQVEEDAPDAVVMFMGANEGYDFEGPDGEPIKCCGADWAAVYASRVRQMADTYRQDGEARLYWLKIPLPRDPDRQEVAKVVNEAIEVGVQPWRSQIRVLETDPTFAPDGTYTDSIDVEGESTIVREGDGIHLNDVGSAIAADQVLEAVENDFEP